MSEPKVKAQWYIYTPPLTDTHVKPLKPSRNILCGFRSIALIGRMWRQRNWQSSFADEIASVTETLQVGIQVSREAVTEIWVAEDYDSTDNGVEGRGDECGGFVDDLASLAVGLLESLLLYWRIEI